MIKIKKKCKKIGKGLFVFMRKVLFFDFLGEKLIFWL
ncbi:hypothetical protein P799_05245 [Lysinibacillus sphaericus CBAM5]|uniref:Uncharacterized protein n=1 Tax=Lysinibacillus sphaericus CBAM5 TaxID=1400869 RepID=W7SCI5_LYSSH|nr:hypothetical protein P799_05245 [Lysinibacillus sphaericus CBAM5]